MTTEQQNTAWACLPNNIRQVLRSMIKSEDYTSAQKWMLYMLFGSHNLTLDTEPEEMLIVKRKEVQGVYSQAEQNRISAIPGSSATSKHHGFMLALELLFGDKCLPDKEPMKIDAADSLIAMAKDGLGINDKQPSVQVEPKFKYNIGDLVTYKGKVKKIIQREYGDGTIEYMASLLNGQSPLWFNEVELEPYTEPETKDNMKENPFMVGDEVMFATGMDSDTYIVERIEGMNIVIDRGKIYHSDMFVLFDRKN